MRRRQFHLFYNQRHKVVNWFFFYCLHSSLILQVASILAPLRMRNIRVKCCYCDGMVLYYPLTSIAHAVGGIVLDVYMSDFAKYFAEEIAFEKGDIVVDIGSYIGGFSIPLALNNPEISIFSFEAASDNFNCLWAGMEKNKINNLRIENMAVHSEEGHLSFTLGDSPTQGTVTGTGLSFESVKKRTITVEATSLAHIFQKCEIDRCKILKVDCEGSEYAIFSTVPDRVLEKIDYIFIESHPVNGIDPAEFKDYLQDKGFLVQGHFVPSSGCWEWFGKRARRRDG